MLYILASLKEGDCFGEFALLSNKPRAARIETEFDGAEFASLEKIEYKRIIGE